jgi:CheY-like chemotaxis protein
MPPVLVISAYATTEKRAEALAAGVDGFITKPMDVRKLSSALAGLQFAVEPEPEPGAEPAAQAGYDFHALRSLGEPEAMLARYARELEDNWTGVQRDWRQQPAEARQLVHRLRAQVLLTQAELAADQLKLLERALAESWPETEIAALLASAGHEIAHLLAAARKR